MTAKDDDNEPCYLTRALAGDLEFTQCANAAAVQIAQKLMSAGFRPCGHTTLGMLGLSASAASTEPHITEDDYAALAREYFRYHRANPHNLTLVPGGEESSHAETRH